MLRAVRQALEGRSETVEVDGRWLTDGLDPFGEIFAPEGVEHTGDAGALMLSAFFAGVRLRAGLISSLPLRWELNGEPQDVVPPILAQPDPTETVAVTVKRMAASLSMRGNALGVLGGFDDLGFPNVLKVIHPAGVIAKLTQEGPAYQIAGKDYRWDQVLHARGLTLPGAVLAVSPIEAARRNLAGAAEVEEYGRRWFRRSGLPSVVVKIDRPRAEIDERELRKLKAKWMSMLSGGREPVFVPKDISVESLSISNEDSQAIQTREMDLQGISNIVGVPGYFLGAKGSSRTYTNMQDERRALLDIYLREDIEAIEDAFTALLPAGEAKFDPSSFLRLDQKLTAEVMTLESHWLTIDELRAIQGYPPLADGAGKVLASSMASIPAPPAPPSGGGSK